jgi:hypothetical protein
MINTPYVPTPSHLHRRRLQGDPESELNIGVQAEYGVRSNCWAQAKNLDLDENRVGTQAVSQNPVSDVENRGGMYSIHIFT